jgi:hypothetical protein
MTEGFSLRDSLVACRKAAQEAHQILVAELPADSDAAVVLGLHAPNKDGKCEGCDMDGYECEEPEWPCRTYQLLAERRGRVFTRDRYLWWRMDKGITITVGEDERG